MSRGHLRLYTEILPLSVAQAKENQSLGTRKFSEVAVTLPSKKMAETLVAHQKSYDERAGQMLMPVNQINQIYQLRRVCWNHFSFFSIIFS